MNLCEIIINIKSLLRNNDIDTSKVTELFQNLRQLIVSKNQQHLVYDFLRDKGGLYHFLLQELIQSNILNINTQLSLYTFQFITNFITGNEKNQKFILEDFQDGQIYNIYEKWIKQSPQILKCAWIFVFNIIKLQKSQTKELILIHPFYSKLLRLLVDHFFEETGDVDEKAISLEWITYYLNEVMNQNSSIDFSMVKYLFNLEGQFIQNYTNHKFETTYLFIFHLLQKTIDDRVHYTLIQGLKPDQCEIRELYSSNKNQIGIQLNIQDFYYLLNEFQMARNLFNQGVYKDNLIPSLETITRILKLFCLITFLGGFNSAVQKLFYPELLQDMLDQLCVLKNLYNISNQNNTLKELIDKDLYHELFSIYLRMIGNITHLNPIGQKIILDNGKQNYIQASLGFTKIDTTQPLAREWSVILLRNLTESNLENQKRINQVLK